MSLSYAPGADLVLAHGLGGRSDLPISATAAAWTTAAIVAVSFLVTSFARSTSPADRERMTYRVPGAVRRLIDSRVTTAVLRAVVLALTLFVVTVAVAGPQRSAFNLAPYALYVLFWVGLVPLSIVFGPFWRRVNPLRTIHAGLCLALRRDRNSGVRTLPAGIGIWPSALALLVFVWLELVYPDQAEPAVVLTFLGTYAVAQVGLALVFGARWFDAGDGFEVYSRLIGSMAPLGRTADGSLILRSPLAGLSALRPVPGLTAVTAVLLGSTGFDGLTRTQWWQTSMTSDSVLFPTLAMLWLVLLVAALLTTAVLAGQRLARTNTKVAMPVEALAPSLVPIALGYTVAHYFSYLLYQGRRALDLVSNPFEMNTLTIGNEIVSSATIGAVQLYAIVTGHVLGVLVAHDRAAAMWDSRSARLSQIPLAVVMVVITLCGVLLLLSS